MRKSVCKCGSVARKGRAQKGVRKACASGSRKACANGSRKSARNRSRAKGRTLEVAGCTTSRRSCSFCFSLFPLSLSSLSHTLSFLELRRLAEHAPVRSSWFSAGTRTLSARRRTTRSSTTCGEASAARRPHNGCPRSWNTVHRERPLADPVRHNVVLWSST